MTIFLAIIEVLPLVFQIVKMLLERGEVPKDFFNQAHEAVKSRDPKKLQNIIRDL